MNQRQTQYVSVFSTELFARYLHIRCLSVINCHESTQASLPDEIQQYRQRLCESPDLVTTDVLAFKCTSIIICQSVKRKLTVLKEENKPAISHHLDTSELVELLQKSAVEHLTTCRQLEAQQFGLSQQTTRRCTSTNLATVSDVYSLHRTYTRLGGAAVRASDF